MANNSIFCEICDLPKNNKALNITKFEQENIENISWLLNIFQLFLNIFCGKGKTHYFFSWNIKYMHNKDSNPLTVLLGAYTTSSDFLLLKWMNDLYLIICQNIIERICNLWRIFFFFKSIARCRKQQHKSSRWIVLKRLSISLPLSFGLVYKVLHRSLGWYPIT